jgi:putative NADH-flavin reductase
MLEAEPPHPYFYDVEAVFAAEAAIFRNEQDLDWLLVAPPAELYPYGEVTGQYRVGKDTLLVSDPANPAFKEVSVLSMEDLAFFVAEEIERQRYSRELITLAN